MDHTQINTSQIISLQKLTFIVTERIVKPYPTIRGWRKIIINKKNQKTLKKKVGRE